MTEKRLPRRPAPPARPHPDRPCVLVVEDDERLRNAVARTLRARGYRVHSARDGAGAMRTVQRRAPDLVLLDVRLPDVDGLALMRELKTADPALPAIVFTGYGTVAGAVDAMRLGAHDYLEKPVRPSRLLEAVDRVVRHTRPAAADRPGDSDRLWLVGVSAALGRVRRAIVQAASAPRTAVLIQGESGTGKELVARSIHQAGPGRGEPFVGLNCAALPESLLESELFGYAKGAFTGAAPAGKRGLFAAAGRGTLFLDEIGEMAPALQAKLLRVLQERSFRPVGATADEPVECRVVASTNRVLERAVARGEFRRDLFYRLNVLTIAIRPLRERPEDILPLARHFLVHSANELNKNVIGFSDEAESALRAHTWPGNVRELQNVVEHAVLVCSGGEIGRGHLGLGRAEIAPAPHRHLALRSFKIRAMEEALIRLVLKEAGGNVSAAARELGINRSTLYAKIREHGLAGRKRWT